MHRKLTDLGATLAVIVLFAVVLAAIFLGGQIADDLFGKIGLGSTAASIWSYARWPVALVAATAAYGIVYGLAPDIEPRKIRWITPGAIVGVVLWIALSLGFSIYVRNFRATARPTAPSARRSCCCCGSSCRPTPSSSAPSSTPSSTRSATDDQASSRASSRSVSSGG